ncbi:MAG: TonB-dependent receptor [Prosthecobacter sp.]|nr:TonB-dependent receptor [Prosthecobacter sp.]
MSAPCGGDSFWQFNAFAGYRFHRNLCEVSAGVLNLTDQNYQLSPLNPWSDIARERTFVVRFRLSF